MTDRYKKMQKRLKNGEFVVLDGGVGTELEKRGVSMDDSWCGSASLNIEILKHSF